jgi:flagellar basal body rod protein FlgF
LTENVIGRLVMYDQNGRSVDVENVDEDLRVTNGFKEKGQITPDEELMQMIDTGVGYEKQEPITYWREKL